MEANRYRGAIPPTYYLPWITFLLILVTTILGFLGYAPHRLHERFYHTLALYVMGGSFELGGDIRWEIAVARITAPLSLATGTLWAVLKLLRDSGNAVYLFFAKNHVVIAAEGDDAMDFAEDALQQGRKTVLIDSSGGEPRVEEFRRRGVIVVKGMPDQYPLLWRCRVHNAARLICYTTSDTLNIRSLVHAQELVGAHRSPKMRTKGKLPCHARVDNPRLRDSLEEIEVSEEQCETTNTYLFSLATASARLASEEFPFELNHEADQISRPEVVIAGGSREAEEFFLQAARIGHYSSREPLRIYWFYEDIEQIQSRTDSLEKEFGDLIELHTLAVSDSSPDAYISALKEHPEIPNLNSFTSFVCALESDCDTFILTQQLQILLDREHCRIITCLRRENDLARLVANSGEPNIPDTRIAGDRRIIGGWNPIVSQDREKAAIAIHNEYSQFYPDQPSWDDLSEAKRDQNRFAADHIPIKLRALGINPESLPDREELSQRIEENLEMLAEMEHRRWCSVHYLSGYRHGENRSEAWKTHPDLIPWNKLCEEEKEKDRQSVRAIPRILLPTT